MIILIAAAIPYVTGKVHRGRMGGSLIPAMMRHRFLRAIGEVAVLGGGQDIHGAPVEKLIRQHGPSYPAKKSAEFAEEYAKVGLVFDTYVRTNESHHRHCFQRIFRAGSGELLHLQPVAYFTCDHCGRVADRQVRGLCRACGAQVVKDICQTPGCPSVSSPVCLTQVRCRLCGRPLQSRHGTQVVMDLHRYAERIKSWAAEACPEMGPELERFFATPSTRFREVSRQCTHGIPSPVASGRTIYVWIQALMVYNSMLQRSGADTLEIFCGIDNASFHTIILPTMLIAAGLAQRLPRRVHLRQYVRYGGSKMSSSQSVDTLLSQLGVPPQLAVFDTLRMDTLKHSKQWNHQGVKHTYDWYHRFLNLCNRVLRFLPGRTFQIRRTFLEAPSLKRSDWSASCAQLLRATGQFERKFTHSEGWKYGFDDALLQQFVDLLFHLEFYMPTTVAQLKRRMRMQQQPPQVSFESGGSVPPFGRYSSSVP